MKYKHILIIILLILIIIVYKVNYELFTSREKYTAIIIEPREHKALEYVLNNFLDNLSSDWSIIVFHGNKNIDFVNQILNKMPEDKRARISLSNLNVDNLTIAEYSKLFFDKSFYDKIPTEIFLVFQTDTVICSNNKDKINDYLEYDWVGAPWPSGSDAIKNNRMNIGNGGLSLRHKSKMLEIVNTLPAPPYGENEDISFANGCTIKNCKIPDIEKQKEFSNESILTKNSFGIHKVWLYHNDEEMSKKYSTCPEIKIVKELQ